MLQQFLIVLAAAAIGALVAWLLTRKPKKEPKKEPPEQEKAPEAGGDIGEEQERQEQERREQENRRKEEERRRQEEERRKEEKKRQEQERLAEEQKKKVELQQKCQQIQALCMKEPMLKNALLKQAGLDGGELTPAVVGQIAGKISSNALQCFDLAANQKEFNVDVKSCNEPIQVLFPTRDIVPEPLTDFDQLPNLSPDELALDDDQFYYKAAEGNLMVMQAYEMDSTRRIAYILRDVSPSMDEEMRPGMSRHVWAGGIIVNLLLDAVKKW